MARQNQTDRGFDIGSQLTSLYRDQTILNLHETTPKAGQEGAILRPNVKGNVIAISRGRFLKKEESTTPPYLTFDDALRSGTRDVRLGRGNLIFVPMQSFDEYAGFQPSTQSFSMNALTRTNIGKVLQLTIDTTPLLQDGVHQTFIGTFLGFIGNPQKTGICFDTCVLSTNLAELSEVTVMSDAPDDQPSSQKGPDMSLAELNAPINTPWQDGIVRSETPPQEGYTAELLPIGEETTCRELRGEPNFMWRYDVVDLNTGDTVRSGRILVIKMEEGEAFLIYLDQPQWFPINRATFPKGIGLRRA